MSPAKRSRKHEFRLLTTAVLIGLLVLIPLASAGKGGSKGGGGSGQLTFSAPFESGDFSSACTSMFAEPFPCADVGGDAVPTSGQVVAGLRAYPGSTFAFRDAWVAGSFSLPSPATEIVATIRVYVDDVEISTGAGVEIAKVGIFGRIGHSACEAAALNIYGVQHVGRLGSALIQPGVYDVVVHSSFAVDNCLLRPGAHWVNGGVYAAVIADDGSATGIDYADATIEGVVQSIDVSFR